MTDGRKFCKNKHTQDTTKHTTATATLATKRTDLTFFFLNRNSSWRFLSSYPPFAAMSSCPLSPTSTRRTISFSPDKDIREILHRNDYSPEETKSAWYSIAELKKLKKDAKRIIQNFAFLDDSDDDCAGLRGLECRTYGGKAQKRKNKVNARSAVLSEQTRQRKIGVLDAEAIADAYYNFTEHCLIMAQLMGFRDEVNARKTDKMLLRIDEICSQNAKTRSTPCQQSFRCKQDNEKSVFWIQKQLQMPIMILQNSV